MDGVWYRAAVNIGHNPTFRSKAVETTHVTIEAFLLDFGGDIYERAIRVDFLHKLRDERRFDSVEELVAQMQPRHRRDGRSRGPGVRRGRPRAPGASRRRGTRRGRGFVRRAFACATLARPSSRLRVANPLLGSRILLRGR